MCSTPGNINSAPRICLRQTLLSNHQERRTTSGVGVTVGVRPQLRVDALGPGLIGGEVLPRTAGPVKVWRLQRGVWRVVAHPQILPSGKFRTPLRLRPTVYRITAGDGAFAPALRRLVVTRSMLSSLRR